MIIGGFESRQPGGEHKVYPSEEHQIVTKHTLPGFYGRILDEITLLDDRTFQNTTKLAMRGSLPSEYLRRRAVLEDVFHMPTRYNGQVKTGDAEPQMAVTQPYIEQDIANPPTPEDINAFMEAFGFEKVASTLLANPEIKEVTWYRQIDGILVTDAHPRNFRKDLRNRMWAIDLSVSLVPKVAGNLLAAPESPWSSPSDEFLPPQPLLEFL